LATLHFKFFLLTLSLKNSSFCNFVNIFPLPDAEGINAPYGPDSESFSSTNPSILVSLFFIAFFDFLSNSPRVEGGVSTFLILIFQPLH